jgi:hypothetical protein
LKKRGLPGHAERALAPISPSSCGICSIINSLAIDSIANPHLNDDLGTIITFPDETSGLDPGLRFTLFRLHLSLKKFSISGLVFDSASRSQAVRIPP